MHNYSILAIVVLIAIFAFVLGVLVYVGGALLQTVNFAQVPEPRTALTSGLTGLAIAIIFAFIQRKQNKG